MPFCRCPKIGGNGGASNTCGSTDATRLRRRRHAAMMVTAGEHLDYAKLGQRIQRERQSRGLSQRWLATKLNQGRSTVAQCETGRRRISLEDLERVSAVLGVPMSLFFGDPDIRTLEYLNDEERNEVAMFVDFLLHKRKVDW